MKFFVVEQLAVPTPDSLAEYRHWLGASARDWLGDRVHELCYTSVELAPFSRDLGKGLPPFRWLPERRVLLQAEIDAAVLHLYKLSRSQAEWLLDSFTVLRKYEERDHDEFRTKRIVLEIYDELAESIRAGRPYQTRLDPPPADPMLPSFESTERLVLAALNGLMGAGVLDDDGPRSHLRRRLRRGSRGADLSRAKSPRRHRPRVDETVADAVSRRFDELGQLNVTVILDADPEVYRLGFGDQEALDTIRAASAKALFDLREQPGVRIGVVISDDTTMVYSPVSKNVEAGSTSVDKPNALVLTGSLSDRIAIAAGADTSDAVAKPEVGDNALEPARVQEMQANLKANPPKPFDITRKMNVFSSKVQYVEFSASNYRLTTRQIPLPPELVDMADDDLRHRITSRIRAPFDGIGKLDVTIDHDGKPETVKGVDDDWLKKERRRIEDEYTFQINNFGRVILYSDREAFNRAAERFRSIVEKYQAALKDALSRSRSEFEQRIICEFGPRWEQNPPRFFARWRIEATPQNIGAQLQRLAQEIFDSAVSFDDPVVKILYKNVAPENLRERAFLEVLRTIMLKRRVPREIIDSLFESGQAAPETGAFLGR